MGPQASSGPAGLRVERHFEAHRLAGDCQARAYEQVVPSMCALDLAAELPNHTEIAQIPIESLRAKGVAA